MKQLKCQQSKENTDSERYYKNYRDWILKLQRILNKNKEGTAPAVPVNANGISNRVEKPTTGGNSSG